MEGAVQNRMKTDQNFMWWRARMLGGRTNHWGRVSLRMGPYDFKPKSRDGLGFDWPISYEDVAPWYDKADQLVGIFGSKEGLENNPDSDFFLPPPKARAYERLLQRGGKKLGIPVIPSRMAILTRPINGRQSCFYATSCGRGCAIRANFQSTTVLIPPALETGNLDVLSDAMAREVTLDEQGRATGVHFIDKATGQEQHASARVVILAASTCETARMLLNSRSANFPQGLGNSSGHVGRWLTDSTGGSFSGRIPALENIPLHNEDGISSMHTYAPWWPFQGSTRRKARVPARILYGVERRTHDARFGRRQRLSRGQSLRREAEKRGAPILRDFRRFPCARGNGAEREVMARTRSGEEGSLGHPRASLSFRVERLRTQAGASHAKDVRRIARSLRRRGIASARKRTPRRRSPRAEA